MHYRLLQRVDLRIGGFISDFLSFVWFSNAGRLRWMRKAAKWRVLRFPGSRSAVNAFSVAAVPDSQEGLNHQMFRRICVTYMAQLSIKKDVQAHLRQAKRSAMLEHHIKSVRASGRVAIESLDHMLKSIPSDQQKAAT